MKISPVVSTSNSVSGSGSVETPQFSHVQNFRALKMSTNANPTYIQSPLEQSVPSQEQSVSDSSGESGEATQPISPQFAALAKQRRALQVKERELLAREKAMSSPSGQTDSIALARLRAEPLNVLLEAGVTYDQLTEQILANQGNSEINALKAELNSLKEGLDKKLTDRDVQAEQQVLAEMRREAQQLVAQGEDFEMVRGTGSIPDVMKLIERTYRETGEVLDTKEALQLVEEELFKEVQKMANFKKVQSHFNPQQAPQMQRHQGMRTLTNRDTASIPMSRQARALAAFNGTLRR